MHHPDQLESHGTTASHRQAGSLGIRLGIAAAFVVGLIALSKFYGSKEILEILAAQESRADSFREAHPVAVYAVAFLLYVVVTGLSLPGAAALTIAYGWFFDFVPALILVSFASTTGATLAFLMSRYLLRDSIQERFGDRLDSFNRALEQEGATYLFTLRLIPAVPFFVINLVMGLTPVRTRTFWWVSQLGMLPGTAVFTYAGHSFPEISDIQTVVDEHGLGGLLTSSGSELNLSNLLIALILLGLLPVVLKFVAKKIKKTRSPDNAPSHSDAPPKP